MSLPHAPRPARWIALLALAAALVACGGEDASPAPSPTPAPAADEPDPDAPEEASPPSTAEDGVQIVGPVVLGSPSELTVPAVQGPEAWRDLVLAVASAERLRCDAHAEHEGESRDAQMALLRDGETLQQNSDGGERFDARITFDAEPGTYHVRVWEWLYREATITVRCARAPAAEPSGDDPGE